MRRALIASNGVDLCLPEHKDDAIVLRLVNPSANTDEEDLNDMLTVFVGDHSSFHEGKLPIAGRYERVGDVLTFTPMFGFAQGQDHIVRIRRRGEPDWFSKFHIAAPSIADARVTAVYPSGHALPENTLRFYIHFSVPMEPGVAANFVCLQDEFGAIDDAAFMQFKQELWNKDRTRLTVLIDPGRIKKGVSTNIKLGPALLEHRRYTLVINGGWRAADGFSELPTWSKSFMVIAPLRKRPNIQLWVIDFAQPNTCDSLQIKFDRPFDRHLIEQSIHVVTESGRVLLGTSKVGESELSWSFIPDEPWPEGQVHILVDELLEDVAGNTFYELLDQEKTTTHECKG